MKPCLVDGPAGGKGAGLLVEDHLERPGGEIRDPAMEAVAESAFRREVGCAVADKPAAGHELVEAVEPPQTRWFGQRHKPRVHRPADRRLPSPFRPGGIHLPDPEPPVGKEEQTGLPGNELHHPHPFGKAADERPAADRQRAHGDIDLGRRTRDDAAPLVRLDDRHHTRIRHEISPLMR